MTHTPGFWRLEEGRSFSVETETGIPICEVLSVMTVSKKKADKALQFDQIEEVKANARFIAAAPELYIGIKNFLAALQAFANDGNIPQKIAYDKAEADLNAALAKAEGKTL